MQNLEFHPDVSIDIKDSYKWYEKQSEGLGEDLDDIFYQDFHILLFIKLMKR